MNDAKDDAGRVKVAFSDSTHEPVEDVEEAVGAESNEVEGIDDSRYGCLAEEEKLREDADGLKDDGEGPKDLMRMSA